MKHITLEEYLVKIGNYELTLKLIDRDDSDKVIASKTTTIKVGEVEEAEEDLPKELPKTGTNIYIPLVTISIVILGAYIFLNKKH